MMNLDARDMIHATVAAGAASPAQKPRQLSPLALMVASQPIIEAKVADRARRLRAHRRVRADRADRRRDLLRLCVPAIRDLRPLLCRHRARGRGARGHRLPGRRHLSPARVPPARQSARQAHRRLVARLPLLRRRDVLRAARRSLFARLARRLLRHRAALALRLPPDALRQGAALEPRGPARPPRRAGRRRRARRDAGDRARAAGGLRSAPARRVRRPRRRARAELLRRAAQARHRRRAGRIRPPHPRRPGAVLAADLGRGPHPADAEEAVGAARSTSAFRRTPTSCASARAPIPTSARCRCSTCSTGRSPTGTS